MFVQRGDVSRSIQLTSLMLCPSGIQGDGKHFAMLLYPKFKIVICSSLFWIRCSLFLRK